MAKTKKKTDYQYNYKPTGENVEEIVNWLQHQSDKPFSLNILIQQAMHKYGKTTDLKQLMLNQFINGDLSNGIQNAQAKPKQAPNNPTPQPDPNPDSVQKPNLFPQPDPYSKPIVSKITSKITDPHPTVMLNNDHHDSLPDNTKTISKQSQIPTQHDVEDDSEDDSAPNLAMLSKH